MIETENLTKHWALQIALSKMPFIFLYMQREASLFHNYKEINTMTTAAKLFTPFSNTYWSL